MQLHHKIFLTSMALLLVVLNANCQTKMTEGRIEYSANFRDTTNLSFLDKIVAQNFKFWIKGHKNRAEFSMGMDNTMIQIYDDKTHDKIVFSLNDTKKEAVKIKNADKD